MNNRISTDFQVSVIIPVYNAEKFVVKAVESAVDLKEVVEIILVEDASLDNSLEICQFLKKKYKKVKLIQHPDTANHGEAASRNIGILTAKMDYVAFLDADDWYLPNRFLKDQEVFNKFYMADAVYSCTILEQEQDDFSKRNGAKFDIREKIGYDASQKEFYKTVTQNRQDLHNTNSITIKRNFLNKEKLFDERLRLHTDSELWKRLMRRGNFFAGEINEPVAVIRRHEGNVITTRNFNTELKFMAIFIDNVGIENLYDFEINSLCKRGLRKKSEQFENHWKRRAFYYFNYLYYSKGKKKFLSEIKEEYKDLEI